VILGARWHILAGVALAVAQAGCIDRSTGPFVAGLEIVALDTAVLAGHELSLAIRAWDIERRPVTPQHLVWTSADPTVLTVDSFGTARARVGTAGGDITVWASAGPGQGSDTVVIHVAVPGEVKWRLGLGPMPDIGGVTEGLDGTLYVLSPIDPGAQLGILYAISPGGAVKWQYSLSGVLANVPIVGSDGTIYVMGQHLWAFGPDGDLLWSVTTRPLTSFGHLAAVGNDGTVYAAMAFDLLALRGSTGDTVWQGPAAADGGWLLPPTISADGRSVYVKNTGDSSYAFATADGSIRWQVSDPVTGQNSFGVGIASSGGTLVVTTNLLLQIVDTLGNPLDVSPNHGCCPSEPAIGPDGTLHVQIAGSQNGVWAYNPVSVERWGFRGANPNRGWYGGPALAADGVLYAAGRDGFYALQIGATGATVRWRFPADTSQHLKFYGAPLIGRDGTVYTFTSTVGGTDPIDATDELFAFWEDKPVEPNSPWPMWRHDARRSGQAHR
jgi:outer membrane protein assembly factor BamB